MLCLEVLTTGVPPPLRLALACEAAGPHPCCEVGRCRTACISCRCSLGGLAGCGPPTRESEGIAACTKVVLPLQKCEIRRPQLSRTAYLLGVISAKRSF